MILGDRVWDRDLMESPRVSNLHLSRTGSLHITTTPRHRIAAGMAGGASSGVLGGAVGARRPQPHALGSPASAAGAAVGAAASYMPALTTPQGVAAPLPQRQQQQQQQQPNTYAPLSPLLDTKDLRDEYMSHPSPVSKSIVKLYEIQHERLQERCALAEGALQKSNQTLDRLNDMVISNDASPMLTTCTSVLNLLSFMKEVRS